MRKFLFFTCYALTAAVPAALYLFSLRQGFSAYTVSVALGITAYALICDQFILASRPGPVVKALGQKGTITLHQIAPIAIVAIAVTHKFVKEASGFSDDTPQASLGGATLAVFAAIIVLALLFMASTFLQKLKPLASLKRFAQEKIGIGYKRLRLLHNLTVLAAMAITAHVLLASSSNFAANPIGAAWMLGWMVFSLSLYAFYRMKGRRVGKGSSSKLVVHD